MRHIDDTENSRPAGTRPNVLWGGSRKRLLTLLALVIALATMGATVDSAEASGDKAYVTPSLLAQAQAHPDRLFDVIVQAVRGKRSDDVEKATKRTLDDDRAKSARFKRKHASVDGVSATLTGRQILKLAHKSEVFAITEDAATGATYSNSQQWVPATEILEKGTNPWNASYGFPTIAIVDSGVQARSDFGSRLRTQVSFVSSGPNSSGDGFGHGTLVASIAAGSAEGYTGISPKSDIVSLDVLDDNGVGAMSDVLAACDWILANKSTYNIRVANFSINAGSGASILYDPLDAAVERLWLNGVVVVVAAGNYAVNGAESGVLFSPANDPFVITVGASDVNGTGGNSNDFAAPWSAWGSTYDGFRKPELSAPGRQITAAVPSTSTLAALFPSRKAGNDYMWMSGTSFAAPAVSGAAAWFLAKYPSWTPDQVKGALMLDLDVPSGYAPGGALGLGVLDADGDVGTSSPPNPNAALNQFVVSTSAGYAFDRQAWRQAASANASWNSASWSSASWSSASWSSASWSSASWSSASWSSASWATSLGVE
jgi:serine protease AprX